MTVMSMGRAPAVVLGSDFSDPTNERLILLSAAGLAIVGLALLVGTIVWWRRGRQEHPSLAPLEVMGTRSWHKAPEGDRRRRLERVRVGGPGPNPDEPIRPEPVDLQALVRSVPQAFDDLREPGEAHKDAVESPEVADGKVVGDGEAEVAEVAPVAEVAEVAESQPAAEVAPVEPEGDRPNGEVAPALVVVDPDATSFSAERPPIAPPVRPPGDKVPAAGVNSESSEALASSHGDQP